MDLIMILLRQTTARWKEAQEGEDEIGQRNQSRSANKYNAKIE
jgi:hypothetical protein